MTDHTDETDPLARRRLITAMIEALPGRASKVAYMDEAEFHATVQVLADLWIDLGPTLVLQALNRRADMQRQVAALSSATSWLIETPDAPSLP